MLLRPIERLAKELMKAHGLTGWTFYFDNAKARNGLCNHDRKTISLSKHYVRLNNEPVIKNTILHEIAHALIGYQHGHNQTWKRQAKAIGCTGERCSSGTVQTKPTWKGSCPNNCESGLYAFRRRNVACRRCCFRFNNGKYDEKYKLIWSKNND